MRLDHIAYRVKDRAKTVDFFIKAFGYKMQTEFDLKFDDGTCARCCALEPPEKKKLNCPWLVPGDIGFIHPDRKEQILEESCLYHMAPEIFVSDGDPDSIVGQWVATRMGIGGVHHLAYQVESVQAKMDEWKEKGYAEFASEKPLTCPDLTQVFTKPSELTGVIYEFIERGAHGFCAENVKSLMESTKNADAELKLKADNPEATVNETHKQDSIG